MAASPGPSTEASSEQTLAVLGYHKIGPPSPSAWDTRFYVPEETFAGQLRLLRDAGWEPVDLAAVLAALAGTELLPPQVALITFDDGYRSVYDRALPHMVELGFPGVVFVPAAYVGGSSDWTADFSEAPEPICGWEELRMLQETGISVQSHCFTHPWLSKLTPAEVDEELAQSKAVLESGLGRRVEAIAFPFGDGGRDPAAMRAALERAGYRAAFGNRGPPMRLPPENRYGLNRLMMFRETDLVAELQRRASSVT